MTENVGADNLSALPNIRHGFFTREGGVSGGIYESLNCGWGSGDDTSHVRENRTRVASALGVREPQLITAHQIHSATALIVEAPFAHDARPEADALVTNRPGIALGVLTADCAPVLLADAQAGVIAAAHAGWKGAFGGIVGSTLARMEELGARAERVQAAIGPCIAQASYEVGAEFVERLVAQEAANSAFFTAPHEGGKAYFDLRGYVKSRLQAAGIKDIFVSPHDTLAEEERFFSFRRATLRREGAYGRQISAITLT